MKRFLSLVLTLVMVMSLVTVSAGAKDFTDDDSITYDEAVAVISEIGVVDGYADGDFKPANTLTRQAAAKIICNLILGPTTAAELHADTAPYRDVPANGEFAGYIAYCQKEGIISGYADGSFRPGGTLTGYAFMKMLLGALGYDATLESYVGANWSINVAKQAIGIGLNKGLVEEFNGIKAVTREEACLYAFNTLQADLVEYGQRLTTNINGTEVTLSSGGAQSRTWKSQQSRVNNIREDEIIQFAEEYFSKLVKAPDSDKFERPAHTWVYDKKVQIGTWTDTDKLLETYTTGVSGRDLYDLLGSAVIRDYDLEVYVDGHEANNSTGTASTDYAQYNYAGTDEEIASAELKRSNTDDLGITGNGVLTEIFKDDDAEIIRIVSIHTWLGQATSSYNESRETASFKIFKGLTSSGVVSVSKSAHSEDVPEAADVTGDTFYLVRMSDKDTTLLEIVDLEEPEILEQSTVTKFSNGKDDNTAALYPKTLTTNGNEYKKSNRAYYDADTLNQYDADLLTTNTYNVYLDKYGYFIGIDLFEGTRQYVFVTGYDMRNSNLSIKTAEASGIFLDGTMETMTVNVKDTNKNIESMVTSNGDTNAQAYYQTWGTNASDGVFLLNRWYTYTVTEAGVYTLKPCVNKDGEAMMLAAKTDNAADSELKMNCAKLRLDGVDDDEALLMGETMTYVNSTVNIGAGPAKFDLTSMRAYGEDDSVFITVDTDDVSGAYVGSGVGQGKITKAITEVNGVYTGVQDVDIITRLTDRVVGDYRASKGGALAATPANNWTSTTDVAANPQNNYIQNGDHSYLGENAYAVFDKNNFIIGAVILGEAEGNNGTKAYILDPVKYERYENGTYYWQFEAVINGEVVKQEAESKFASTIDTMRNNQFEIVELRYKAADSEIVTDVKELDRDDTDATSATDKIYGYPFAEVLTGGHKVKDNETVYDVVLTGNTGTTHAATGDTVTVFTWVERPRNNAEEHKAAYSNDFTFKTTQMGTLKLQGRTLYIDASQHDYGVDFVRDAKAVVIQPEGYVDEQGAQKADMETRAYSTVQEAIDSLGDADTTSAATKEFRGIITAVLNSQGVAEWIVFYSDTMVQNRNNTNVGGATMDVIINVRFPGSDAAEYWRTIQVAKPAVGTIVDVANPDTLNGAPIKAGYQPKLDSIPVTWEKNAANKSVTFEYELIGGGGEGPTTGTKTVRVAYSTDFTNDTTKASSQVGYQNVTLTLDAAGFADLNATHFTKIPDGFVLTTGATGTTFTKLVKSTDSDVIYVQVQERTDVTKVEILPAARAADITLEVKYDGDADAVKAAAEDAGLQVEVTYGTEENNNVATRTLAADASGLAWDAAGTTDAAEIQVGYTPANGSEMMSANKVAVKLFATLAKANIAGGDDVAGWTVGGTIPAKVSVGDTITFTLTQDAAADLTETTFESKTATVTSTKGSFETTGEKAATVELTTPGVASTGAGDAGTLAVITVTATVKTITADAFAITVSVS
ncbi:S-layer homology domain-containing protein [Oscillibacter sp. 1-3]|uniref:S-layer homology domain-containing protein n=1 Tax=Oscillibacter sp. 1-3 TaxID=1235797 RepID=UPI0003374658|nr:S-layer homology domain-containing protein [Oscillibacter sp. 1-3]EOS65430.1 hypothetical protein C816_02214 [Oscillibacter sp. 1-3]